MFNFSIDIFCDTISAVVFVNLSLNIYVDMLLNFVRKLFQVLALRGSYHGDTLGAMEAQAPSSYTGFLQQPWYEILCDKSV